MIRHLHDVVGLEPLEKIAHDHGVDLVARGGLARRLFTLAVRQPTVSAPDLFDLLPFTADIDLTHTGGRDATKAIMEAVRREVPLADCFRWELRSAEEEIDARLSRPYGPVVPVHGVTIGVRAGFDVKGIMLAGGTVAWKDALTADEHDTFISIEIPG